MEGEAQTVEATADSEADDLQLHIICEVVETKIRLIRDYIKEYDMLPSSNSPEGTKPSAGRSRGGMTYLRNEMLTIQPKEAKIQAVKLDNENKFGARVVLKLTLDGAIVFWGVNIRKNPNFALLEKKFGLDENEWAGQRILLGLEQDEFTENYQVRVSFPPAKTGRG